MWKGCHFAQETKRQSEAPECWKMLEAYVESPSFHDAWRGGLVSLDSFNQGTFGRQSHPKRGCAKASRCKSLSLSV